MEKSSFITPERYLAYVSETNEKKLLAHELKRDYSERKLSIQPLNTGKNILDLGCGPGANIPVLQEIAHGNIVVAIDISERHVERIQQQNVQNVISIVCPFEDFKEKNFDFILASHVLQYIDTDEKQFITKIYETLAPGGQAWIVQQTRFGMAELIAHQREFLSSTRFSHWNTFHNYVDMVHELSLQKGFRYETKILESSFEGISFGNPTPTDKLRLEFIFGLNSTFDQTENEFKEHLTRLRHQSRIYHPNGIIKIYK